MASCGTGARFGRRRPRPGRAGDSRNRDTSALALAGPGTRPGTKLLPQEPLELRALGRKLREPGVRREIPAVKADVAGQLRVFEEILVLVEEATLAHVEAPELRGRVECPQGDYDPIGSPAVLPEQADEGALAGTDAEVHVLVQVEDVERGLGEELVVFALRREVRAQQDGARGIERLDRRVERDLAVLRDLAQARLVDTVPGRDGGTRPVALDEPPPGLGERAGIAGLILPAADERHDRHAGRLRGAQV